MSSSAIDEVYGAGLSELESALERLYAVVLEMPSVFVDEPQSESEAQAVARDCEDWVLRLANAYGVIPERPHAFTDPTAAGEHPGVLGFFSSYPMIPPVVPPLADVLGVLPPDLARQAGGNPDQRGGLLRSSDSWRQELSATARMVLDAPLLTDWQVARSVLLRVTMHFRMLALRLIGWAKERLEEFRRVVLPEIVLEPARGLEWRATVTMAGLRRTRVVGDAQVQFLRSLVEDYRLDGSLKTKRLRLGEQLPEIIPFVMPAKRARQPRPKARFTRYILDEAMMGRITFADASQL